jgi:hypothetical protein
MKTSLVSPNPDLLFVGVICKTKLSNMPVQFVSMNIMQNLLLTTPYSPGALFLPATDILNLNLLQLHHISYHPHLGTLSFMLPPQGVGIVVFLTPKFVITSHMFPTLHLEFPLGRSKYNMTNTAFPSGFSQKFSLFLCLLLAALL